MKFHAKKPASFDSPPAAGTSVVERESRSSMTRQRETLLTYEDGHCETLERDEAGINLVRRLERRLVEKEGKIEAAH